MSSKKKIIISIIILILVIILGCTYYFLFREKEIIHDVEFYLNGEDTITIPLGNEYIEVC